ncbi:hypothetical protein [Halobacteriovorax sp. JY17]|uniref:hypothetical protein n=1 Tax=Halobacteriovorax sp. JY17 TaxID=2014617 RepID=UPI000C6C1D29|nr:hypothetical protein [Halobacteriovorax sp. JY17]PIK13952.1 MAG: hypothetical protein CES88_13280 [Halobacteriovorax sp. JY17]
MKPIYLALLILLFMQWPCFSKVLENKAISLSSEKYSFRDVCKAMGVKNNLVEVAKGQTKIDCTSRVVSILDFCKKNSSKRQSLIRGRVDVLSKNNVVCEYAKSVILKVECDTDFKCSSSIKNDCLKLKNAFAYTLELTHSSKLENSISCIYSSDEPLDI